MSIKGSKSNSPTARPHTSCRCCGSQHLDVYLDLGEMPLVNRYLETPSGLLNEPRFPLQIARCRDCWLSQLTCVVDPAILFSHYAYCSSVSQTFSDHCQLMARQMKTLYQLDGQSRIVEIASNDGCLQSAFREEGLRVTGVEPAANLVEIARSKELEVVHTFWTDTVARGFRDSGGCDLVVATNVLAHVDNIHDFLGAVASCLSEKGVFVFEVPYLGTFLTRTEFDTTYHEHLSYFLLHPLVDALKRAGLEAIGVSEIDIHGGSLRVHATRIGGRKKSPHVQLFLQKEKDCGFLSEEVYICFSRHVCQVREELTVFLSGLKGRGKRIAAYGASAKGNILLNYCGLDQSVIDYIIDDTKVKQGRYCPGNGIRIYSRQQLQDQPPDYLLLLAWNFAEELISRVPEFSNEGGRFVIPIPALRVI